MEGRIVHAVKLERHASDERSTRAPELLVDENLMLHLYPDTVEVPSPLMTLDCASVRLMTLGADGHRLRCMQVREELIGSDWV